MFSVIWAESRLLWNIPLLVSLICIFLLYGILLKRLNALQEYRNQSGFLVIGLAFLYLTIGSPLSTFSHLSFSFHMLQMSILFFIIPPMILLGIARPVLQSIQGISIFKRPGKWRSVPMLTLIAFSSLFFLYHLPMVLTLLSQNTSIHTGYTLLLFLLSFGMWWPIAASAPAQHFSGERKRRYIFLSGLIIMPACMLFIISALFGEMTNPFLSQMAVGVCLPSNFQSTNLIPSVFNARIDQLMSGFLMLGMHKLGLMMVYYFGKIFCV